MHFKYNDVSISSLSVTYAPSGIILSFKEAFFSHCNIYTIHSKCDKEDFGSNVRSKSHGRLDSMR